MSMPCSTLGPGQCSGMPDVCKTPTPAGPVPIPYPNIATNAMVMPPTAAMTVLVGGKPAVIENTQISMSNGDNAGVAGGVVSNTVMGPVQFKMGSKTVQMMGRGACYLGSLTAHNGAGNANDPVGSQIAPSAPNVLLSP